MMLLETTISKNYVPNWGYHEGIRELVQNALDADEQGYDMGITYLRPERKLMIFNWGANLDYSCLLLGTTVKNKDKKLRGKYGEGFKIGSLALIREGKPVTIHNGLYNEKWVCGLTMSEQYHSEVLSFNIQEKSSACRDKLIFEVGNVSPQEWKSLNMVFLSMYDLDKKLYYKAPEGRVILDKNLKGRVYCGGIFVTHDKELEYGYDFNPTALELNRDRNMVSNFDLLWNTSKLWAFISANIRGQLYQVTTLLKTGVPDVKYLDRFADYTVKGKIAEEFIKENSDKAYPVTTNDEAKEVRNLGFEPVFSSDTYASTVREDLGTIESLKRTVEMDWKIFQKLTAADEANLRWAFSVMEKIAPKFEFEVKIAKFKIENTRSISDSGVLIINCNLITKKYDLLHEMINYYSGREVKKVNTHVWKDVCRKLVDGIE